MCIEGVDGACSVGCHLSGDVSRRCSYRPWYNGPYFCAASLRRVTFGTWQWEGAMRVGYNS